MSWENIFRPMKQEYEKLVPTEVVNLPDLPKDILKWIDVARPIVDNNPRFILPMWEEIYRDNFPFKFILGGRQIFKSTYTTDILSFETTAFAGRQVGYIAPDDISRSGFAKQRLQYGTFEPNPILKLFPRHKLGSVREISMKNGSTIYTFIDHGGYAQVEGKSLQHSMADEAQYQDIDNIDRVTLAMSTTQGSFTVLGVGGEVGSAYEKLWKTTDQRFWVFDDEYWREKLRFGYIKSKNKWGFLWGEYLKDVMRGHWEIPEHARGNTMFHGYWLPQTIFPHIPLTRQEAMDSKKYNVHPKYSIEDRRENVATDTFISHIMGQMYLGSKRPITEALVESCMLDYKYLSLLEPEEIAELKEAYGGRIKICMGVDWGSGNPSYTVIAIIIEWIGLNDGPSRFQLVYLDKRPKEDQMKQAERVLELFNKCKCDMGVADLGHGANQVKFIQDGGFSHFTGEAVKGLGSRIFVGCRTIESEDTPLYVKNKHTDEHGTNLAEFRIDKHGKIQDFVNLLGAKVMHPLYPNTAEYKRSKFIIPFLESGNYRRRWLIDDLVATTRLDIEKLEKNKGENDHRIFSRMQFNHPKDSLMALIYAMIGFEKKSYNWFSI